MFWAMVEVSGRQREWVTRKKFNLHVTFDISSSRAWECEKLDFQISTHLQHQYITPVILNKILQYKKGDKIE
jgi:hypothetical protein